jgi:hypothetical protein
MSQELRLDIVKLLLAHNVGPADLVATARQVLTFVTEQDGAEASANVGSAPDDLVVHNKNGGAKEGNHRGTEAQREEGLPPEAAEQAVAATTEEGSERPDGSEPSVASVPSSVTSVQPSSVEQLRGPDDRWTPELKARFLSDLETHGCEWVIPRYGFMTARGVRVVESHFRRQAAKVSRPDPKPAAQEPEVPEAAGGTVEAPVVDILDWVRAEGLSVRRGKADEGWYWEGESGFTLRQVVTKANDLRRRNGLPAFADPHPDPLAVPEHGGRSICGSSLGEAA